MASMSITPQDGRSLHDSSIFEPSTPASTTLALRDLDSESADGAFDDPSTPTDATMQHLPPADTGYQAYMCLAACFMTEALVWGFPFSFGVMQEYYSTHEPFNKQPKGIAVIGTSASGIMYLSSPLCFYIMDRFPAWRRKLAIIGLLISSLTLIAASFATSVTHLILTQGIGYAIGGGLWWSPAIVYLEEWFVRRRGMAYGIMWSGTGLAGVVIPILMNLSLEKWGFASTMRIWATTVVVLSGPLMYFTRPRLPISKSSGPKKIGWGFFKSGTFYIYMLGNIFQGLGFFIPGLFLPSYAVSIGLSRAKGSLMLSLFNATSTIGQMGLGFLSDKIDVTYVILISCLGSALSVFLFWGFSMSLPLLVIFALVYGFFAGGFTSTYTKTAESISNKHPAGLGLLMGFMAMGRGIGAVACGPLSSALIGEGIQARGKFAWDGPYANLVIFTGITTLLGATSWVSLRLPKWNVWKVLKTREGFVAN